MNLSTLLVGLHSLSEKYTLLLFFGVMNVCLWGLCVTNFLRFCLDVDRLAFSWRPNSSHLAITWVMYGRYHQGSRISQDVHKLSQTSDYQQESKFFKFCPNIRLSTKIYSLDFGLEVGQ